MAETVDRSNEIVFRSSSCIASSDFLQHWIIGISEEYWLDVGIVYTNVLHTVFFFVAACKLVLLDDTVYIVLTSSTDNDTILCLAVHCLCIDVVMFLVVLYQPTFFLELLEVLCSLFVDTWVIFTCTFWEIYFRLNDMVKALFVALSFFACLL